MRRAMLVFALLIVGLAPAMGQELPDPLPENNPDHKALADTLYPSARVCADCHPRQFEQWSYSSHAYATISPMFNKFEPALNAFASGTVNYFCFRCHASVGTALGERRDIEFWERSQASQEGITCITCHRVGEVMGKLNGERRITPGDIHEPVNGPFDGEGVLEAIVNPRKYKVLVAPYQPDQPGWARIHRTAIQSDMISRSELCVTCHQVQVHPSIKLETVWEEYRASPAAKEGTTCQDCHMSKIPGQNVGTEIGWAADLDGKYVREDRPLGDHSFIGPGYPAIHPGLFPISKEESEFSMQTWLKFDYREEWGSDDFEAKVAADPRSYKFPHEWSHVEDRQKAWGIVQKNLGVWEFRKQKRLELLEHSSRIDGPFFNGGIKLGQPLSFKYKVSNLNKGHNMPSGSLGAQPQAWLNVALTDPDGELIWESGYLDSRGDLVDIHSLDLAAGTIEFDSQLFNLQAKFLTTNIKGTDREMYLPVQFDVDQRPHIRPGNVPVSLLNHPPGTRMEKRSIPPLASRFAKYKVPGNLITKAGTYQLAVRMRSRPEPIYFMKFVGATTDMKRSMNEWITDVHPYAVEFDIGGASMSRAAPTMAAKAEPTAAEAAAAEAEMEAPEMEAAAADAETAAQEVAAQAAAEAAAREAAAAEMAAAEAAAREAAEMAAAEAAAEAAAREAAAGKRRVSAMAAPCLSVRAEPSPSANRLQCLAPGTVVEVVDQRDDWSRVQLRDGSYGWMVSRLLEPMAEMAEGVGS